MLRVTAPLAAAASFATAPPMRRVAFLSASFVRSAAPYHAGSTAGFVFEARRFRAQGAQAASQTGPTPAAVATNAQRRMFLEASKNVPKTPGGANAYDIFEVVPTATTTMEDMAKQFKKLAVLYHPDREGGSHDKMADINAAFAIIKEHHGSVCKALSGMSPDFAAQETYRTAKTEKDTRESEMGRNGGLRQNVRAMNQQRFRGAAEIQTAWNDLRREREIQAARMCGRFEVACATGIFFKRSGVLNEIAVRERALRKNFTKNVWEEVHEMRSELLRRGARNLQMSQLAEEMVAFASQVQKKLDDDFTRQAQQMFQAQARFYAQRAFLLVLITTTGFTTVWSILKTMFNSLSTVRYKEAFFGSGAKHDPSAAS